jgi:L-ascorbate metabolism protein UlaG (beta-lactamase superfamily)
LSGDVVGFVLAFEGNSPKPIYVAGDTVWYDGVAEVAHRFDAGIVMPFAGAAQTRGPFHLATNDVIETARAFPHAVIVPVHYDSWAHFKQNGNDLEVSFKALGVAER